VRGPFRILDARNFSADQHTRVLLYTSDLGLTIPNASLLTVQANGVPLTVENVGPITGVAGLNGSYVVVRLPDNLPTGTLTLTLTYRGQTSNSTTIGIIPLLGNDILSASSTLGSPRSGRWHKARGERSEPRETRIRTQH
jgi:hypothetical protein